MGAPSVTRTFDVAAFKRIEIDSGLVVTIAAGGPQRVEAAGHNEADLDRLVLEVKDETLRVSVRHEAFGIGWFGHHHLQLDIAAPVIEAVEAGTGSKVTFTAGATPHLKLRSDAGSHLDAAAIDSERLEAIACAGSKLTLSGRCMYAELQSSAGSALEADGLTAAAVAAESSGGSHVRANATEEADVAASAGARVEVKGNPSRVRQEGDISSSIHFG